VWLRRCTPVPALVVFFVHVWLMHHAMMGHTGGQPSYPVDDAFIHLSLARHIAFEGVFGVTPHTFASASSSIVWPWLLAAMMRVFGNSAWLPLGLNLIFGASVPFAVDWTARRLGSPELGALRRMFLDVFVVVLCPLPTLAIIGMEHTLHVLVLTLFVAVASTYIADLKGRRWPLLLLAVLAVSTRYESLFAIGLVILLLAARRAWSSALALAVAAALPVVVFGIYAKAHGSYFLPVSVLLKGRPIEIKSATDAVDMFGGDILHRLSEQAHLFAVCIAAAWLVWWSAKERGFWTPRTIALGVVVGSLVAHIELAGLGWFYRYDSYLVALTVTVVGITIGSETPRTTFARMWTRTYWLAIAAGVLTFGPMLPRVIAAAKSTPSAGGNIYEQQVQTAKFLARHFPDDVVAINDIGAVTYYREGPIVDLVGLANVDVAKAKKLKLEEPMKPADMVRFSAPATVAVIYEEWFPHLVPPTWFRVARWTIPNNVTCAFASVSVYATKAADVPRVVAAARDFEASELPKDVRVDGYAADSPGNEGVTARDAVEITVDGTSEPGAYIVADDGSVKVTDVGEVPIRGVRDGESVKWKEKQLHVRLLERHAPRVCFTGAVRQSVCLDGNVALDAIAAADPLPSARLSDLYVWRDGVGGLVRIAGDVAPLRDRDIVVIP
jgi:hypothetical protein